MSLLFQMGFYLVVDCVIYNHFLILTHALMNESHQHKAAAKADLNSFCE